MTQPTLWFDTAPEISDQAAHDILGFLYELITAFENKYYASEEQDSHLLGCSRPAC